jgi:hypothetical protein
MNFSLPLRGFCQEPVQGLLITTIRLEDFLLASALSLSVLIPFELID